MCLTSLRPTQFMKLPEVIETSFTLQSQAAVSTYKRPINRRQPLTVFSFSRDVVDDGRGGVVGGRRRAVVRVELDPSVR